MKEKIHPKYNSAAAVTCVCGNQTTVGSTKDKFDVDVCYNCHPFYTGKAKVMDTAGRVEKFKARATAKVAPVEKKVRAKKQSNIVL
jgi:large subunit ribosomal protein L31